MKSRAARFLGIPNGQARVAFASPSRPQQRFTHPQSPLSVSILHHLRCGSDDLENTRFLASTSCSTELSARARAWRPSARGRRRYRYVLIFADLWSSSGLQNASRWHQWSQLVYERSFWGLAGPHILHAMHARSSAEKIAANAITP